AWDKELTRLVKEKNTIDSQLTELNRIFALSVKERQAEAIAMGRMPSEDGVRGSGGSPISPVIPRPAVPEPPTLNPPSRIEQPAGARQQTPAPTPGRSPFDEFPVLRPGSGPVSPPSTTAVATPPSVPKSGGGNDPRSEQHKTLKCPECGAANYPTEWYCERCGGELATM
ncbi:MAG TPA: zinc ribbon domain-containing protein, partial [Gemmatimonadaceae bacterium]|nr:zinc ribbon domain-containing protein [Gemmatimonadaceae bacterium]